MASRSRESRLEDFIESNNEVDVKAYLTELVVLQTDHGRVCASIPVIGKDNNIVVYFWKVIYALKTRHVLFMIINNARWIVETFSPGIRMYYYKIIRKDGRTKNYSERAMSMAKNIWHTGSKQSRAIEPPMISNMRVYNQCETDVSDAVHNLSTFILDPHPYDAESKARHEKNVKVMTVGSRLLFDLIICFYPIISTNVFSSIALSTYIHTTGELKEQVLTEAGSVYDAWLTNNLDYRSPENVYRWLFYISYALLHARVTNSDLVPEDREKVRDTFQFLDMQFDASYEQLTRPEPTHENTIMKVYKRVSPLQIHYPIEEEIHDIESKIRSVLSERYGQTPQQIKEYMRDTVAITLTGDVTRLYYSGKMDPIEKEGLDAWADERKLHDALYLHALKRAYFALSGTRTTNTFFNNARRTYAALTSSSPRRQRSPEEKSWS